ncbi:hypothetical protein VTH06DRAFT_2820 [Thermothelomyces fergusii]
MAKTEVSTAGGGTESAVPGFTKLSSQVFVREGQPSALDPAHPSTVVIYGWGDANPRHLAKYVEGYGRLFPHSKIVLIFSPILKALYQTLEARSRTMLPVIEAVYPEVLGKPAGEKPAGGRERVLLHVMSNTGGMNCAATMNAYCKHTGGAVFPHDMLVCDSTPGTHPLSSPTWALGREPWPLVQPGGFPGRSP